MNKNQAYIAEIRPQWRRTWLERIAEFSDYDLQRRSWFGSPEYNSPHWSFVEWMCTYFDDISLSSGYAGFVEDGLVSQDEADIVRDFHAAADAYTPPNGDDYDHSVILSDPAWLNVVSLADEARLRLLEILAEPSERTILERNNG
jgi:hypothetical protein